MSDTVNVQEIGRAALATLYGPDGRPVSSADPEKPRLVDAKAEPIKRSISADDIEGLDPSKEQFIYARTADGKPAGHGNDYRFYTHELDPAKMKEVDPAALYVGKTQPRPQPKLEVKAAPKMPPPRNRHERRRAEKFRRSGGS